MFKELGWWGWGDLNSHSKEPASKTGVSTNFTTSPLDLSDNSILGGFCQRKTSESGGVMIDFLLCAPEIGMGEVRSWKLDRM